MHPGFPIAACPLVRVGLLSFAVTMMVAPARAEDFKFFEQKIRPVLVDCCYRCHGADAEQVKAGLHLDNREGIRRGGESGQPAVVPGQPEKSRLVEVIRDSNHELRRPPKEQLTDRQITDFVTWIKLGAPDPRSGQAQATQSKNRSAEHWAFKPVKRPVVPAVNNKRWAQTPIDAFILAKLEEKKISPASAADRRTLLRRATYDLLGLPPTPEEIDAFLADHSPDAFSKVVDRLLASPAYGERWGRHWLDVVRYADARDLIQLPVESD
ncbi:MAG: DUF1549 domain-containing protein, partial [Verrucomicrobiota bacterium]